MVYTIAVFVIPVNAKSGIVTSRKTPFHVLIANWRRKKVNLSSCSCTSVTVPSVGKSWNKQGESPAAVRQQTERGRLRGTAKRAACRRMWREACGKCTMRRIKLIWVFGAHNLGLISSWIKGHSFLPPSQLSCLLRHIKLQKRLFLFF